MSELDDILMGFWGGVKFENDRFEQEYREIKRPERLDPYEQKALIIELFLKLIGKDENLPTGHPQYESGFGRDTIRAELRAKVERL